nr:HlyD family efflux transporter periplasmic adaptor subunit [candidate division Zixibacteria bacterium]
MEVYKMKYLFIAVLTAAGLLMVSCGSNDRIPGGSGMIEATEVLVSSEATGRLMDLHFDRADPISAGDTIAYIDTVTTALRFHQAEAMHQAAITQRQISILGQEQAETNLDLARKEYDRVKTLLESGSANQQQYDKIENTFHQAELTVRQARAARDAAEADLKKAESELALLTEQLHNCFPTAPISGRVIDKYIEIGELVGIGKPLIKIGKLDTVWVKVYLPPADLTDLILGATANIDPEDGRGTMLEGKISWISAEAEFTPKNIQTKQARADLVYAVKITISNPEERLKIGMPVMVTIP